MAIIIMVLFVIGCGLATVGLGIDDFYKIHSLVLRSAIFATYWTGMAAALFALFGFVYLEFTGELHVPTWTLICWWLSVAIIMPYFVLAFAKYLVIELLTDR